MSSINPFPEFPVSRLEAVLSSPLTTVPTQSVILMREFVEQWLESLASGAGSYPLVVSIRGDFGSGKTHLLADARSTLEVAARARGMQPTVVLATAQSSAPLEWFREVLGPRLAPQALVDCALRLYASAAQEVAGRAKLTERAVGQLSQKPHSVRELVREELINPTAVEEAFSSLIDRALGAVPSHVRAAAKSLVWEHSGSATAWFAGMQLTEKAAADLGIPPRISTSTEALDAVVAVAALHKAAGRPFCVMLDEIEHQTNRGSARENAASAAWLKRLLEGLASHNGGALVAGHWSAWQATQDFLDRFPSSRVIKLVRLTSDDVLALVGGRVGPTPHFGEAEAAIVAAATDGNMRKTFSLLHSLHADFGGFTRPMSAAAISGMAREQAERPAVEDVAPTVLAALVSAGFVVEEAATMPPGVTFELVAQQSGYPTLAIDIATPNYETVALDQLSRFLAKTDEARTHAASPVVGLLLTYGPLDAEARREVEGRHDATVFWLDAATPDFIERFSDIVRSSAQVTYQSGADHSELQGALHALQGRRQQELDEMVGRAGSKPPPPAYAAGRDLILQTPALDYRDRLTFAYHEFTKRPSFARRVSTILTGVPGMAFFTLLVAAIIVGTALPSWLASALVDASVGLIYETCRSFAAVLFLIAAWILFRSYVRLDAFFEFRNRKLRDIYLTTEDVAELTRLHDSLMFSYERFGSRWQYNLSDLEREPFSTSRETFGR